VSRLHGLSVIARVRDPELIGREPDRGMLEKREGQLTGAGPHTTLASIDHGRGFQEEGAWGLRCSGHSASVLNHTQKRGEQMTGLFEEGQQLERARAR
jgi:hypothetical protein